MKKAFLILTALVLLLTPVFALAEGEPVFAFENFEYEVFVGKTVEIAPVMQNIEGSKKATYAWSSSDESVATVTKGTIKGIQSGKAKIECEATLEDGAKYIASCTINVIQPITKISVEETDLVLLIDLEYKPEVEFTPENASNQTLIWTTSNPEIATVDEDGTIHPLMIGKCKIKAQTTDGTKKELTLNVSIPEVVVEENTYTVSSPEGIEIPYWTQGYSNYNFMWTADYFDAKIGEGVDNFIKEAPMYERSKRSVIITPVKAGTGYLYITDIGALGGGSRRVSKIQIKIAHDAVFDNVSYPKTTYKKISTDSMIGKQVSIKGTVQRVEEKDSQFYYYIGAENKNDQILVAISNHDEGLAPDQVITLYGVVQKNFQGLTETGLQKTYPCVEVRKVK